MRSPFRRRLGDPPFKWMTVLLGLVWIGLSVLDVLSDPLSFPVLSLAFGSLMLGVLYLWQPRAVRNGYRAGWLEGRAQMIASVEEAHRRGLTGREWVQSQLEADVAFIDEWEARP